MNIRELVAKVTKGKWPETYPATLYIAQDETGGLFCYCAPIKFNGNAWTSLGDYPSLPDSGNWALGSYPLASDYDTNCVSRLEAIRQLENDPDNW